MSERTLFERVGGAVTLGRAVVLFHEKLRADAALRDAMRSVDFAVIAPGQGAFLAWVFGAPAGSISDPTFAGMIEPSLPPTERALVTAHLHSTLLEIGVDPDVVEEVLRLLERSTAVPSALPFDRVVIETGGVRSDHSPADFVTLPLKLRAQLVVARAVTFFRGDTVVNRQDALKALREATASGNRPT